MIQPNESVHGFRVRYIQLLPELKATLYRMEYEQNGADLVWLDREEENKTFAIAFRTIPQDDTGVFHILEHSVLCGSRAYPVKSPFVEMMKRSLKTFMNAFTFPDKTMYPFSTRDDQDFLNLMDVYLDAVLHPLSVTDPMAFRQEGWHYELETPDSPLTINGVVYNEMKGACASPDAVLTGQINRQLFPGNCYRFQYGGNPEHIPELTFKAYQASHRRFYHPSNARIFLDGSIDLDPVLARLDQFLSEFDRQEPEGDIPMQPPVAPSEQTCYYEVTPGGGREKKALLAEGWVCTSFGQPEEILACSILARLLCGSSEAPLKKALVDARLAEDVDLQCIDGVQQPSLILTVRNTDEEQIETVWSVVRNTLETLAADGLDHEQLLSLIDHLEFITRERDYGATPRGVVYAMTALESWLYGGDPSQNLCCGGRFQTLRERVAQGWFEAFLRARLLENPHHARVRMLPSEELGAQRRQRTAQQLAERKAGWSPEQVRQVLEEFAQLRASQTRGNTPEELAVLPTLDLKQISEEQRPIPQEICQIDGITVLHHPLETEGIQYLELYFSLADLPPKALSLAAFMASLLGRIETADCSEAQLRRRMDHSLGRFVAGGVVFDRAGNCDKASPYLLVQVSFLEHKGAEALELLAEILTQTSFRRETLLAQLLHQSITALEQRILMSGNAYAAQRAAAGVSVGGRLTEAMQGIDYLRWQREMARKLAAGEHGFGDALSQIFLRVFSRSRLTVGVTGALDRSWLSQLFQVFPAGAVDARAEYQPLPRRKEGFIIPAPVGFAVKAGNLAQIGTTCSGEARVAAQILSYGYLWDQIRVKGGAYGTGLKVQSDGALSFSSFRDPNAAHSLAVFEGAGEALRDACRQGTALDSYKFSTIAAAEPLLTPRTMGHLAAERYFTGRGQADQQLRREILHTTWEDLKDFSHGLDQICAVAGICVIGGQETVEACRNQLDQIEVL